MPPKRREKDSDPSKSSRSDLVQADHELFLQAFEKPTQIYRYLRTRNMICPIFLNRTLTYMRTRMSRSNKSRKNFRVDSLLQRAKQTSVGQPSGYMTLTFLGYHDKKVGSKQEPVKVETLLVKICHKKRKDVSCPVETISLGTNLVDFNPSPDSPPSMVPTLSIPAEFFSLTEGNQAKSYHLLLRVGTSPPTPNGEIETEPPMKKRKSLKVDSEDDNSWHQYGRDLTIYDKNQRLQLSDGDYDLLLEEAIPGNRVSHTLSTWEYIGVIKRDHGDNITSTFEEFSEGPSIRFSLKWSRDAPTKFVERPKPINLPTEDPLDLNSNKENDRPGKEISKCENKLQIVYQFLYNNNSRQQTEACEDLHCPWCSLDCNTLYSLLKHLKLCHSRFTFTYVPIPGGARIDVAINEFYDGSYSGCPQDLISQPPGMAFSRNGPIRRTCFSNILVCYPKRPQPSLSEFLELDENEFDGQRPYISGHNRLYHHTTTCLPIYPKEMEVDSEDENDPKWLQAKTMMMIDEFTDVNEGEKEIIKMWNLHVMRHGYVGDCQIPLACSMFLQAKGHESLKKNLYRNFVLHMCNLFDFGLVSPVTVYTTIQRLQELIEVGGDESKVLQQSCQAQRQYWVAEGASKSQEQVRRLASPAHGVSERRKPSTIFSAQPKADKVKTPVSEVSKKRTGDQPVRDNPSTPPPAKKKLNVGGKPSAGFEKDKKKCNDKVLEKGEKEKTDVSVKKKVSVSSATPTTKTAAAVTNKEKELAAIKQRRKSSNIVETSNPVVLLRRKSFAGATDTLRKKTLDNGVANNLTNATKSSVS